MQNYINTLKVQMFGEQYCGVGRESVLFCERNCLSLFFIFFQIFNLLGPSLLVTAQFMESPNWEEGRQKKDAFRHPFFIMCNQITAI